jgi:hypothetical protein
LQLNLCVVALFSSHEGNGLSGRLADGSVEDSVGDETFFGVKVFVVIRSNHRIAKTRFYWKLIGWEKTRSLIKPTYKTQKNKKYLCL